MTTTQKVFKNLIFLFSSEIITKLFSFLAIVYLARIMGPAGFGKINFAMAVYMYFWMFSTLGLDILGIREIAKDKKHTLEYVFQIGIIKLSLSSLAYLLLLFAVFIFVPSLQMRLLILFYGLTLFPLAILFEWVFQGLEEMQFINFSRLVSNLLYLLLIIWIVRGENQILFVPLFYSLSYLVAAFLLIFILFRIYRSFNFYFSLDRSKEILRLALPIGASFILAQVFYSFDILILGIMKGETEVGFYSAAFKVYMFVILFANIYHQAIFPRIANYFEILPQKIEKVYNRSNQILAIMAVPLMVGGIIIAPRLVGLLYGDVYMPTILALKILLCGIVLLYINTGYHRGLLACGRTKWYFWGIAVPVIINIILNLILVPFYGLYGAAFATFLGEVSAFIVSYIGFNQIASAPFLRHLFRPFLATLAFVPVLFWGETVGINIFVLAAAAAFIYFAILYLIQGIRGEDLKVLWQTSLVTIGFKEDKI